MTKYDRYCSQTQFDIPATMQALIAKGVGFDNLKVAQVPVPQPGPDQLLVRVDAAGVYTSILKLIEQGDKHTFINGWDLSKWPVILGDEGAVTIVKIGDNLKNTYKLGQRFAIQPAVAVPPINHRERYKKKRRGNAQVCCRLFIGRQSRAVHPYQGGSTKRRVSSDVA